MSERTDASCFIMGTLCLCDVALQSVLRIAPVCGGDHFHNQTLDTMSVLTSYINNLLLCEMHVYKWVYVLHFLCGTLKAISSFILLDCTTYYRTSGTQGKELTNGLK